MLWESFGRRIDPELWGWIEYWDRLSFEIEHEVLREGIGEL